MPALRDLLAPPACLVCGAAGNDLCPRCRRGLPWLPEPRCARCGLPGPCRRCPAAAQAFDASWAPVAYAGPVPRLVAGLKSRRARGATETMVAALARAPELLGGADRVLVPVPTAAPRVRKRGFDQATALATGLADRGSGELRLVLERVGPTTRQRGAGRGERLATDRIVVRLRPGAVVPHACVLIDDVHTTGATFDACARALKAGGATRVVALAYARALP